MTNTARQSEHPCSHHTPTADSLGCHICGKSYYQILAERVEKVEREVGELKVRKDGDC